MSDCLFCKIANKEIPSHCVAEDDYSYAFLDINPSSLGHTVVIPKKHYFSISEMDERDLGFLFAMVKRVGLMLGEAFDNPNMNIGINQGSYAGQEVGHTHVHLIPRRANDEGGSIQSVVSSYNGEDLSETVERIRVSKK
jgi:histidine triad (HIT) family protein